MGNTGPLSGIRIVEFAGIGPGPFCGMILADLGADVVRVDRPSGQMELVPPEMDLLNRGKRSIIADLSTTTGIELALKLAEKADIVFEGFRPGVAERLGIGPEECHAKNPQLVYGRVTGWGQDGPLSQQAGHDLNYIALSGALHAIGPADGPPQIPLALVGDFAGGLYLGIGLLAAVLEARVSGKGQVIDAALLDGATHLMTFFYCLLGAGKWRDERGVNLIDGGAPFYSVYKTRDEKYMAVGAVEQRFHDEFTSRLGVELQEDRMNPKNWPVLRKRFQEIFITRTREEWVEIFAGSDACVSPVLSMKEASTHPHNAARQLFGNWNGMKQPAPAPRFSRTTATSPGAPCRPGEHTDEILKDWLAE